MNSMDNVTSDMDTVCLRSNRISLPSIKVPVTVHGVQREAAAEALIDSGANSTLIHQEFAKKHRMNLKPLNQPIKILNIDGTTNNEGQITHYVEYDMEIKGTQRGKHRETIKLYVTDLGRDDIILGVDRKSTRLNSSHSGESRMPSSA